MADEIKPQQNTNPAPAAFAAGAPRTGERRFTPGGRGGFGGQRGPGGRDRKPFVKKKEEFDEQVVDMRRVARVMAGGKRFRFRVTIVIGDRKGRVGVGMGKGVDVQQAIGKAKNDAKKNILNVRLEKGTIPHEVRAKYSAAEVVLKPAKEGNGLVAGGTVRAVLTLAGVKDITAKCLGRTPNKVTNALATLEALKSITLTRRIAKKVKTEAKVEAPAAAQ